MSGIDPRIRMEYLRTDKPCPEDAAAPDYGSLDILSGGCHIYGSVLIPDGSYTKPRPCVAMFHGFPGTARNDDIAQALRRIGCVVLVPHHRGAWGSEGKYLISNCIEDAINIAEYMRSPAFCREYHVDPSSLFLFGHSMGGNTVLQAARRLPWLRGTILMAPYDPSRYLLTGREEEFRTLLADGKVLQSDGEDAIFADADAHKKDYYFANAAADVKDCNLCLIAALMDTVAPWREMTLPLWEALAPYHTAAVRRLVKLPCGHCMCNSRFSVQECVAEFIRDTLPENFPA